MYYSRKLIFVGLLTGMLSANAQMPNPGDDLPPPPPPAGDAPQQLLSAGTNRLTIYSGAAITNGAGSIVGGNMDAFAAVTLGASNTVGKDIVVGAAITLGDGSIVKGSVTTFQDATMGANSTIEGTLTSGAIIDMGAHTTVGTLEVTEETNSVTSGTAVTLGDTAIVHGNIISAQGPVTLGANSVASDFVTAATSVTISASSNVDALKVMQSTATAFTRAPVIDRREELRVAKAALVSMPITQNLATTMTVDTTLEPGIFNAPGLTTTAGISLTLKGNGTDGTDGTDCTDCTPQLWVFNIDTYLSLGAGTKILLDNVHPDSAVIWNTGGYTFIGALSTFRGTILAGSYATTGQGTTVHGIGDSCGSILTIGGAVTLGANNIVGDVGCIVGVTDTCTVVNGTASCENFPEVCVSNPNEFEYCEDHEDFATD
jgi:carbonic anhydrase/acetyltransferase-like protein (isoleucine patch superfamily)